MMHLTESISTDHTLTLLQRLVPPGAVIQIGSGTGVGQMHRWRNGDIPRALLLDAAYEVHQPAWFTPDTAPPGWSYEAALLSNSNGHACMYHASNPAESGLLKPEELNVIWPNLVTKEQEQRPVTRLDSLLDEPRHTELRTAANIWCVVDCLPALPILQGAGEELQNWSVLWLRVLLKPFDGELQQATLPACQELLEPLGFRCLQVNESNHPALGDAIFVRDWAAWLYPKLRLQEKLAADNHNQLSEISDAKDQLMQQLEELTAARDEQARLADERQASVNQLQQEQETFFNLAAERLAQLGQLTAVRDGQATLIQEQQSQVEQLTAACDEQSRLADEGRASINQLQQEQETLFNLATERLAQLEQLTADRDGQATLVQEQQSQIEQLTSACDEQSRLADEGRASINQLQKEKETLFIQATERLAQLEQLAAYRDEQTRLADERLAECSSLKIRLQEAENSKALLESQLAELEHRQQLMNEEMVKAEGQIELIKDLLLREPGL